MTDLNLNPAKQLVNKTHFLFSALFITMVLFFIDEGYYDFRWMKNIGNWIIFVIYVGIFFGVQLLVSLLLQKLKVKHSAAGIGLTLAILILTLILVTMFV